VPAKYQKLFVDPTGVHSNRDRKLLRRQKRIDRKQEMRQQFVMAASVRSGGRRFAAEADESLDTLFALSPNAAKRTRAKNLTDGSSWASSLRQVRVAGEVERALEAAIHDDYKDHWPHAALLRADLLVESVRMTRDVRRAKVYWTTWHTEQRDAVASALRLVAPKLRSLVTRRVLLKYSPTLEFVQQNPYARREHTESVLDKIKVASQ
jgi:ribosome-binding factor A